ncbi:YraN family protein [Frigoribacterium sp. 2-23]|uniref:YraN family protein n=1 Tax=Frigoribacterium sp. 2-23 TaxID=3415006 RepID=UPI003C6EF482
MAKKDDLGRWGETVAVRHLESVGMRIVDRNWRCREGEIDVVALDADELVVIEVKTRSSTAFGHPLEAVTRTKRDRLRRLAGLWLADHPGASSSVRLDVVAVTGHLGSPAPEVQLVRGIDS